MPQEELNNLQDLGTETDTPAQEPESPPRTPTIEELQAQLEIANKRNSDKDTYITELRESANKALTLEQELEQLRSKVDMSKDSYTKDEVETAYQIHQKETELASVKQDSQRRTNQGTIHNKFSDFEDLKPEISSILREQGISEQEIRSFETDPYQYSLESVALYAENARYRLQNQKLQSKADDVLQNIEKSASHVPVTNSQGLGGASSLGDITLGQAEALSMEQIDAELQRLGLL